MGIWSRRRPEEASALGARPAGFSRQAWQERQRDPAVPLTAPVDGLAELASARGWTLGEADLDQSATDFIHDMVWKLQGNSPSYDPSRSSGGGPNRYADVVHARPAGRTAAAGNVSFTWSILHGGERPAVGSWATCTIDGILPILSITPRRVAPHQRALMPPIRTGEAALEQRFEVRSSQPTFAQQVVPGWAPELLAREDWTLLLNFGALVLVAREPFTAAAQVAERIETVSRLAAAVPQALTEQYAPATRSPIPSEALSAFSPEDRERLSAAIRALSPAERSELFARLRREPPVAVLSALLTQS